MGLHTDPKQIHPEIQVSEHHLAVENVEYPLQILVYLLTTSLRPAAQFRDEHHEVMQTPPLLIPCRHPLPQGLTRFAGGALQVNDRGHLLSAKGIVRK
jgi:hypothetical protein